jgi:hypothetical protein
MNKHMKEHSRKLNIKTTKLASLTAIFRPKKRVPLTPDDPRLPAMDIDASEENPSADNQEGGSGGASGACALQCDGNETENDDGDESDGASEGMLVNSDSEDEFEDEESVGDPEDGVGRGPGVLEFELKAAEAGDVPHRQGLNGTLTEELVF